MPLVVGSLDSCWSSSTSVSLALECSAISTNYCTVHSLVPFLTTSWLSYWSEVSSEEEALRTYKNRYNITGPTSYIDSIYVALSTLASPAPSSSPSPSPSPSPLPPAPKVDKVFNELGLGVYFYLMVYAALGVGNSSLSLSTPLPY